MASDKYLRYGRPTPPADVNQEFMTVQETAYVLSCSVKTVRRRLKDLGIKSLPGNRIVTSRADRTRMHEAGRVPPSAAANGRPPNKQGTARPRGRKAAAVTP
ncbi:DNA-binding protein [Streptomyces sp. NBC_01352]|uniref:DNA-binding protein n=1 Tax=Streptomyces sp. NBC_01352 TaxID=2903834 RepID=UPI002E359AC0|nr:DNA-binding protein [Streptomyces sp. NBC_01352]